MNLPRPQQFTAKLEDKLALNDKYVHYFFELEQPHRLEFVAGQYVSLQVSDKGERRSYSICSTPDIQHGFELLVDIAPNGLGVQFLENLQFGQTVKVLAPMGMFVTPDDPSEEQLVYIATGSGIAPMRSMILDQLRNKQDKRPIVLNWGVRHVRELFWLEDFQAIQEAFPNFTFHPVVSRPETDKWTLCSGRVTDCLKVHDFMPKAGYYLCGNAHMIADVMAFLSEKGIAESHIHHEKFF